MDNYVKQIDILDLATLADLFGVITFSYDFTLIYEAHVPNTGIVLFNGELQISGKGYSMRLLSPGSILGTQNMLENIPFEFTCSVKKDSHVILLPKSEIIKIFEAKNSSLYKTLSQSFV